MAVINSTSFDGTSNNALFANNSSFLGGIAANGFVNTTSIASYAPLANPSFTGTVSSTETLAVRNILEQATVSATAATGTVNVDLFANTVVYFTANASANWTFNFRANSTVTANTYISNGQIATVTILVQQGSTAYYPNSHSIDGSTRTVLWQGGTAPTSGNANSVDGYTYSIIKTAANTYSIIASQTKFA